MTDTSKEAAWDALMNYQQADEDGIMVLVSRQAIHECKGERDALRAQLQAARDEALEEADISVQRVADMCSSEAESVAIMTAVEAIRALKSTSTEGDA